MRYSKLAAGRFIVLMAACILSTCSSLHALAFLDASTSVGIQYTSHTANNCSDYDPVSIATGPATATSSCFRSVVFDPPSTPGFAVGMTADATAVSDFGVLGVLSEVTYGHSGTSGVGQLITVASAFARFYDTIIITSPGMSGIGRVTFQFLVEGVKRASSSSQGGAIPVVNTVKISANLAGPFGVQTSDAFIDGDTLVTATLPISFGAPSLFYVSLNSNSSIATAISNSVALGSADFLNTLTLSGITMSTLSGTPVPDFTILSESGTTYPIALADVPEASCIWLVGSALAPLAWFRRRSLAIKKAIPLSLALTLIALPAFSGPVGVSASTEICFGPVGPTRVCEVRSSHTDSTMAATSYSAAEIHSGAGGDSNYSLNAFGEATFLALRSFSELDVTQADPSLTQIGWRTFASLRDELLISSPGMTGTTGSLLFILSLSGSGTGTGLGGPGAQTFSALDWYAGPDTTTPVLSRIELNGQSVSTTLASNLAVPFTFGGPPVDILIGSVALAGSHCNVPPCSNWAATVQTDASQTVRVVGIAVFDSSGALVPDFNIAATSGYLYTADGIAAVPEVGTFWTAGLLSATWLIRRRSYRKRNTAARDSAASF